jgi:hypothetical protein
MDQYRKMNNAESTIIRKSTVYLKACMWLIHIKLRRQEWVGHICQMDGSITPRKILEGNRQGS